MLKLKDTQTRNTQAIFKTSQAKKKAQTTFNRCKK